MHRKKDGGRLYVGVDIGNDRLDMAATGFRLSVENNRQGWQEALRKIRRLKRHVHFVCEPIGHYGGAFIQFLHTEGKVVSVVHGLRVRNFARATGRSAKTDKIDANAGRARVQVGARADRWAKEATARNPRVDAMPLSYKAISSSANPIPSNG